MQDDKTALAAILKAYDGLKGSSPFYDPCGRSQPDFRITEDSFKALQAAMYAARNPEPPAHRYVVGFMFDREREYVALVTKIKPEWQRGSLNGIGGKIEPGETPLEAMNREFEEETGLGNTTDEWRPLVHAYRQGVNAYEVFYFSAYTDRVFGVETMEAEVISVKPISELSADKIIYNLNWLIPLALDPSTCHDRFVQVEDVDGN